MLTYSTKGIDKAIEEVKKKVSETPDYGQKSIESGWESCAKEYKEDIVLKYYYFGGVYSFTALSCLIGANDKEAFKGYHYLAAMAGEICFQLRDKGIKAKRWLDSPEHFLQTRDNNVFHMILANRYDLAIRMSEPGGLSRSLLIGDYDRAKTLLPKDSKELKDSWYKEPQILWAIANRDEKKFNYFFEKRTKAPRMEARCGLSDPIWSDEWGLAWIKVANRCGMSCKLNVAELPQDLLDDVLVNEADWKLPRDEELEEILGDWQFPLDEEAKKYIGGFKSNED